MTRQENDTVPMKGDLAIAKPGAFDNRGPSIRISCCAVPHRQQVLRVLSDPIKSYDPHWPEGTVLSQVQCDSGNKHWTRTSNLIRIPPQDESRRLFAEHPTERGVGVE